MPGEPPASGCLDLDGVRLEFRFVPPPAPAASAPTLVLLHEGLGCVGLWKTFPERLASATGLGVFLWSRQGFGGSDPITLPRPLDYLDQEAPLVARVLTAAGIGRSVLIGHSDGGTIALLAAGGETSSCIEGIVTMAAHVFVEDVTLVGIRVTERAWEEEDLRARLERWHGPNVEAAFRGWCDTWLDPAFRTWTIEAALPAVRVPVLAMQGADDEYGTRAQVDAIARGVSGPACPMLIPCAGHSPHADAPDAVVAAIRLFLSGLPSVTPSASTL